MSSRHGDLPNALKLGAMAATPQAAWFTSGTPKEVKADVDKTMCQADLTRTVPVLVAYDIPFRDCAQYSAGGALDTASYEAWIDGFAAGIGKRQGGRHPRARQPGDHSLERRERRLVPADGDRFSRQHDQRPGRGSRDPLPQLNYAVDKLAAAAPNALVYLDGTHSGWLNVGDASTRLANAGVARAEGFFLNISNYQLTGNLAQYGTWISECLAYGTSVNPGRLPVVPEPVLERRPPPLLDRPDHR